MPAIVKNIEVEDCLRMSLTQEGYSLSAKRGLGQTGVDIVASKDGTTYHIECIGYKESGPSRAKDFYEGFFRTVSRLNDGATHCVLALSSRAAVGLPARARQHRVAWLRIGDAFPELQIWLVDVGQQGYRKSSWREWAESP